MAFDVVTYALSKKYVNSVIEKLPKGFVYRGAVNYEKDLPASGTTGDVYTVLYRGASGTAVDGREFVWGNYKGIDQWIPIGSDAKESTISIIPINKNAWEQDTTIAPYTYKATVSFSVSEENTMIELLNDNPILFANYCFAIARVDKNTVTFYAYDKPTTDVNLTVRLSWV